MLGKLAAFSMAVILLLSIFVPMIASTVEAGAAASDSYTGEIYIDLSLNSEWLEYAKSGNLKVGSNEITQVGDSTSTLFKTTASASYSGNVELNYSYTIADPAEGKSRVYLKSNTYGEKPYAYYWGGGVTTTAWPGASMTMLKSGFYYFDYPSAATSIIFSNGSNSNQSSDQTIDKTNSVFNGSSWEALNTADITTTHTATIALTERTTDANNKLYVLADGSLQWSKYNDDVTSQTYSGDTVTVKLYAPGWTNHQVVFDVDEPNPAQWQTSNMTEKLTQASNGQTVDYYEVQVPVGSAFYFQPNTNLKTDNLTVPADNVNLYYNVEKNAWVTIDSLVVIADYTVPSNWGDQSNIVGVKATYFDYLSDNEINNSQWLNTPSNGDWFQFGQFNKYISDIAAANSTWSYPLYFGNFYKYNDGKPTEYASAKNGLTRYSDTSSYLYAINNSNGMAKAGGNYNQSLMGLAYPTLDANGDIQAAAGVKMPYFDAAALQKSNVAKVVDSYFPFKATTDADTGVTTYSFNSTNATDNVYFAWDNDVPKYVNYGAGTAYGVTDAGGSYGGSNGYGIFPFNSKVTSMPKLETEEPVETPTEAPTYAAPSGGAPTLYKYARADGNGEIPKDEANLSQAMEWNSQYGYYYLKITDNTGPLFNIEYQGTMYYKATKNAYANGIYVDATWSGWTNIFSTGHGFNEYYIIFEPKNKVICPVSALSGSGSGSGGTPSGDTYTRYNSSNLDFGFGIRLDIDFRVPAYGTVDGTENGTPVTFDYSGDDDLWVYISDDSGKSNLVLDLGGDHKQASGSINFKTMSATANDVFANYAVASSSDLPTVPDGDFWVKTDYQYFCIEVWENKTGGKENNNKYWIDPYERSGGYAKFHLSQFTTNTLGIFSKWQDTDGYLANSQQITLANLNGKIWNADDATEYTGETSGATNLGAVTTYFNGSTEAAANYLDPNKTYHMTVFYMERGQAESNFKVEFTMTVPSHDLTVDKTVNVDNVNSGLKSAVQSNDTFGFTSTQGETVKNSSLGNGGQVTYDKVFTVGESMNVAESTAGAKLSYSTKYTVYDKVSGDTIVSGDGLTSNSFKYINSKEDENEQTSLQAHFENTALTSSLKVSKDLVDKDNVAINNNESSFNFSIGFDLNNSGEYTNYDLNYKLYNDDGTDVVNPLTGINSYTATDGKFAITAQQYVVFEGIPQGAKYKVNETSLAPGYSIYKINGSEYSNPEFEGTVGASQSADSEVSEISEVKFVNKFIPIESNLQAFKNLDNSPYSGTDFTFTQTLLYCDNDEVSDTTYGDYNDTQSSVSSGNVMFKNITYGKTGFYYYSITEGLSDGVDSGKYVMDATSTYYAQVQVTTDTNGLLTVIKKYYKNYDPTTHTVSDEDEITGVPTFNNQTATKYTDVSFTKQDENDNALGGAEFTLYTDATCTTQASIDNASKADSGFTNPATSAESGLVTFTQLKYEPSAAGDVKATYYFKETKAPNGYQLLTGTFKIEIAADGTYKIWYNNSELSTIDKSYIVQNIKQPELPVAGGVGVTMLYVLGVLAVVIAGTAFILYKKRINLLALAKQLINRK